MRGNCYNLPYKRERNAASHGKSGGQTAADFEPATVRNCALTDDTSKIQFAEEATINRGLEKAALGHFCTQTLPTKSFETPLKIGNSRLGCHSSVLL